MMTATEFITYMNARNGDRIVTKEDQARHMGAEMFRLAETDEGMRDLLDKATEYYVLRTEK